MGLKKSNKNKFYIIIGIFVFFVLVGIMSNEPDSKEPDKLTAYSASEEFVKKNLKAPSTAKYPRYDESFVTDLGGGRFSVSAYVDAQNGFGAQTRTQYTCIVRGKDWLNWTLESISM